MSERCFSAATLDDVMRYAIDAIQKHGERVSTATKGANLELRGVRLEITNPRARLSRTESRGKPFSCLGEFFWYLSGSNAVDFIAYYLPRYRKADEGGVVFGGYGPRLIGSAAGNQIVNVTKLLRAKPGTRRAVIQLFDGKDILDDHKDVPCTCTLQLLCRGGELHMMVSMRSNDVVVGLPHDVFCFTMLQELVARSLGTEPGTYTHFAGSLHLYDETVELAKDFLTEGWQPTTVEMPPMPLGDPWPAVATLLNLEERIRTSAPVADEELEQLDVYWADIVRLLQIYKCIKPPRDFGRMKDLRDAVSSAAYHQYIDSKLRNA